MRIRGLEWQEDGACNDPKVLTGWFYPDLQVTQNQHPGKGREFVEGIAYATARKFCKGCPVREQCLEFAASTKEPFGMWGGRTPSERGVYDWQRNHNESSVCVAGREA